MRMISCSASRLMRDAFEPLCAQIESRWRKWLGSSLIDDVTEAVREAKKHH